MSETMTQLLDGNNADTAKGGSGYTAPVKLTKKDIFKHGTYPYKT